MWGNRLREVKYLAKGHRADEWQRQDAKADLRDPCTAPSGDPQQDKIKSTLSRELSCALVGQALEIPLLLSPLISSLCPPPPFIGDTAFIISI